MGNLQIGRAYRTKIYRLNVKPTEFENCDKDGNVLKKISGTYTKGHFVNENTGEEYPTAFKLRNGKPMGKISKTKEVSNYKEVDLVEAEDLIVEKEYLVVCDLLYDDLTSSGKALKFAFSNGNGYKVYFAYIKPSELYEGYCVMNLGLGKKSEVITQIVEGLKEQKKVKEIQTIVEGIEKVSAEELIEI